MKSHVSRQDTTRHWYGSLITTLYLKNEATYNRYNFDIHQICIIFGKPHVQLSWILIANAISHLAILVPTFL